ncbi:MAG TPA: hypothetical protein VNO81_05825 [Candidatus Nitrosotenuis sp.]|nr:hypothetical protein [Candidatus Nitrosotenuis sp.]
MNILANLLRKPDALAMGELPVTDFSFDDLALAFENLPRDLQPAWPLLKEIRASEQFSKDFGPLLRALCRPIELQRAIALLQWIPAQHQKANGKRRDILFRLYAFYLATASRQAGFRRCLPTLRLLSKSEKWRPARELCAEVAGVCADHLLHPQLARILNKDRPASAIAIHSRLIPKASTPEHTLAQCLEALAGDWPDAGCAPEVLGALWALFSPQNTEVAAQARRLLDCELEIVLDGLQISSEAKICPEATQRAVPYRIDLAIIDAPKVPVASLTGEIIEAKVEDEPWHLLVGEPHGPNFCRRILRWKLRLRRLDPRGRDRAKLHQLIIETICQILDQCLLRHLPEDQRRHKIDLARSFIARRILEAGQFDIGVAQRLLQEDILIYFRQLAPRRAGRSTALNDLLQRHHLLRRQLAEAEASPVPDTRAELRKSLAAQLRRVEDEIAGLVAKDEHVHAQLLHMVREKIGRHFQYSESSIPFELFQNADDAVLELEVLEEFDARQDEKLSLFLVEVREDFIGFGHRGRPINRFRSRTGRELRDRGFERDLEKMLAMHGSDKDEEGEGHRLARTGKFGLGFKSVFLAADVVQILSGRLSFEIMGGMYPRHLEMERQVWIPPEASDSSSQETRIALLRPASWADPEAWRQRILGKFKAWLPLQLVFARRIHTVHWNDAKANENLEISWHPRSVPEVPEVSVGALSPLVERALTLQSRSGAVLFGLDAHGIRPLPEGLPRCWVTTPLRERVPVNFAFNARFEVDIGRNQLACDSNSNCALARHLGTEAGALLARLYEAAPCESTWAAIREALGLADTCTIHVFWETVWNILAEAVRRREASSMTNAVELVQELGSACLRALTSGRKLIPSGLDGPFRTLTTLEKIRAYTAGLLEKGEVFEQAINLLRTAARPGELISRRQKEVLATVYGQQFAPERLDLGALLRQSCPEGRVCPGRTAGLSKLFDLTFLGRWESSHYAEVQALKEKLGRLLFRAADDGWVSAKELLDPSASQEESLLAKFCPSSFHLHRDYDRGERLFFQSCRGEFEVSLDCIVDWFLGASDERSRQDALRYVLEGEQGREVASRVRARTCGSAPAWLARSLNPSALREMGFQSAQADELLRLLSPRTPFIPPQPRLPEMTREGALDRLRKLQAWWRQHRDRELRKYEEETYPDGVPDWLGLTESSSHRDRENWLILLALGALHTMGRQREPQHRNFLKLLQRKGWMDRLLRVEEDPVGLAEILKQYFESRYSDSKYFRWLRYLPSLYQLSRWIYEYSACLWEFGKTSSPQRVEDFLNMSSSRLWEQSGLSAPGLRRTLGLGACFVFRELVRTGVIRNRNLYLYCYVPRRLMREAFAALTGEELTRGASYHTSTEIWEKLGRYLTEEDRHFGHCFDLPFVLYYRSQNPEAEDRRDREIRRLRQEMRSYF